jgi:hypothetical protein
LPPLLLCRWLLLSLLLSLLLLLQPEYRDNKPRKDPKDPKAPKEPRNKPELVRAPKMLQATEMTLEVADAVFAAEGDKVGSTGVLR